MLGISNLKLEEYHWLLPRAVAAACGLHPTGLTEPVVNRFGLLLPDGKPDAVTGLDADGVGEWCQHGGASAQALESSVPLQGVEAAGEEVRDGTGELDALEKDLHDCCDRRRQQHADDAPKSAPDHEGEKNRYRM